MTSGSNSREPPQIYRLLMLLRAGGGALVRSLDCSTDELHAADRDGRLTTDGDGYGYVWRPPQNGEVR